jgi:C-terminal processing protease CtpA/Prc
MYLKPNGFFKYPFEYNMSGLEFIAEGEKLDEFIIYKIRKGSAADGIGFVPGDRLVALNKLPEKKLTLSNIYIELSEREGKQVTLTILREGSFISKSFLLKKEI